MRRRLRIHARLLASAYLAGEWERTGLLQRGTALMGRSGRWHRNLVALVLARYPSPPHDARDGLAEFIDAAEPFDDAWHRRYIKELHQVLIDAPHMVRPRWSVRPLHTLRDLAEWLGVTDGELSWFADRGGFERTARDERLRNYAYRWLPKKSGESALSPFPAKRNGRRDCARRPFL